MKSKVIKNKNSIGRKAFILFCVAMLAFPLAHILFFDLYSNFEGLLLIFKTYDYSNGEYIWLWEAGQPIYNNFLNGIKLYFGKGATSATGEVMAGAGSYIGTSFIYYIVSLPCMLTGYMCSYIVFKKFPGTGVIYFIKFIPAMLSSMVMVQLINALFGDVAHKMYAFDFYRLNPANDLDTIAKRFDAWTRENMGLLNNDNTALPTLLIYMVFNAFMGDIAYLVGLMSQTSNDLIEYGKLEGLSYWQEFWIVVFPTVWPFFSMSLFGILVGWIGATGPVYELYGSGSDKAVPESVKSLSYFITVRTMHSADGDSQTFYCYSTAMSVLLGYSKLPIVYGTMKLVSLLDPMRDKSEKKRKAAL